jgi:hypothetical protein
MLREEKKVKRRDLKYSRSNPRCFHGSRGGGIPDNVNVLMAREVTTVGKVGEVPGWNKCWLGENMLNR